MRPMPLHCVLNLAPNVALNLLLALALVPCAARAAQGPVAVAGCPDERATNIPGHEHLSQLSNHCTQHYAILGLQIAVGQRPCPSSIVLHPSRGECQGAASLGSRCVAQGFVTTLLRTCRCVDGASVAFGSSEQACACSDPLAFGLLQNYVTAECAPVLRVGP